jgi:hypothetical protein
VRRAAPGGEQAGPLGLAVGCSAPSFGQVHGEVAAAVAGDAGGDVAQVAADGGAACPGGGGGGEGGGRAVRLCAIAARASQAALAATGRRARGLAPRR